MTEQYIDFRRVSSPDIGLVAIVDHADIYQRDMITYLRNVSKSIIIVGLAAIILVMLFLGLGTYFFQTWWVVLIQLFFLWMFEKPARYVYTNWQIYRSSNSFTEVYIRICKFVGFRIEEHKIGKTELFSVVYNMMRAEIVYAHTFGFDKQFAFNEIPQLEVQGTAFGIQFYKPFILTNKNGEKYEFSFLECYPREDGYVAEYFEKIRANSVDDFVLLHKRAFYVGKKVA